MKKKIIAMTLVALLAIPTVAYAKNGPKAKAPKTKVETKNKQKDKKASKEQMKAAIKAKLATIKSDLKTLETLKKTVNAKRAQLNTAIEDIDNGTKTLPADQLETLKTTASTLNTSYKTITKGLSSIYGQAQKKSKGSDLNTVISALDAISATISDKSSKLTDLGTQYDAALVIANGATDVTTDTTTTTTTDTTTTTTDTTDTTTSTDTSTSGQTTTP